MRDPQTRKISKSEFRDRIVHHAIISILEPIYEKTFIYDSFANRKGKGALSAIKRFDEFKRKVTLNFKVEAFCLKADIKHYFQEVDHEILLQIIQKKIKDEKVVWLIRQILSNLPEKSKSERALGMPLGNLTSQFFANLYLNELDYFVKHALKVTFYIRYVDDFIILSNSKEQLFLWNFKISNFLREKLKLELHPKKSRVIQLSRGIDFVGFRNFDHHRLLRERSIKKMTSQIDLSSKDKLSFPKLLEIFQGWQAYSKWANAFKLRKRIVRKIYSRKHNLLPQQSLKVQRLI